MVKYAIYRLLDPDTNEVRYVGRTSNGEKRVKAHFILSVLKQNKFPIDRWCAKLLRQGKKPTFDYAVTFEKSDNIDKVLNDAETKLIAEYRKAGFRLLNCTDGGEGLTGWKHSSKARKSMREAWKNREPPSQASRNRMSEAGKNRWKSETPKWSKRVRCRETGAEYPTAHAAAIEFGTYKTRILRACRLGRAVGKFTFEFVV
jgi:hypothetical protein